MSIYYTPPATVVDGDVAYAADVNDISTAANTAFLGVESAIDDAGLGAQQWADLAEKWATNPEDVPVEPGLYSSWHWSLKATASASAASTSESNASSSESSASTSESNASSSESNASTSETNASTSASNALASEDKAEEWAENPEDVEVETGQYSAYHWAQKALEAGDIGDHVAATGTAVHGLGTASTETVTTSTFDGTAGRITKVADFGLGTALSTLYTGSNALDNITTTQWGSVASGDVATVNGPPGSSEHGMVTTLRYSTTSAYQMYQENGTNRYESSTYWRSREGGSWTEWRLAYDQWNAVGTVSQSGGIPTGAIIEEDSNANGEYTKFADGTMICRKEINTTSTIETAVGTLYASDTEVWTFPATFVGIDPVVTSSNASSVAIWPSWSTNLTDASFRLYTYVSIGSTRTMYAVAIGRWF